MISIEELNIIKNHAFKNGLDTILYDILFQIPVRDRTFEKLNLSLKNIDIYDSKNPSD